MEYNKLKLVIWDLDDTFWNGTLSEGGIKAIDTNIQLVKTLTDCGIINTICSKNDEQPVMQKLKELGIADYFVFVSVNWQPKGKRIQQMLKDMGLRAVNCLFLDDNIVNLNEAIYYEPNLNIAEPNVIPQLINYFEKQPKKDVAHSRLDNYKILEKKRKAQSEASDNMAFLFDSETHVELHHDCEVQIERLSELVLRTNQLNYTKKRDSKEELLTLIRDNQVKSGYVTVSDKFGNYGIVGFYAIKNNECIHFLFSCRTIGQGAEQYVYANLGYPKLQTVGEVINVVDSSPAPAWINQKVDKTNKLNKYDTKIVFKGACDLQIVASYLKSSNIIEEFTYVSENNKWIEHHNCSVNYLVHPFLPKERKEELLLDCVFNDPIMFQTDMYDQNVALVLLSTMMEANLGIYRNKKTGIQIAFGESHYPLTDKNNWNLYINQEIFTAGNTFTKEWLEDFNSKYEFEGALTPEQILQNAKLTLSKLNPSAKICYFLGSEMPYLKNTQPNYNNRHLIYKQINDLFREWAKTEKRVLLVDFNNYIHSQSDFTSNINHFVRRVYFEAATTINGYISEITGAKAKQKSHIDLYFWSFVDKIGRTGFYQSKFYSIIRKPYIWLKKIFNNNTTNS